jgi:DNA-binding NarL/FixJ family response regulator
MHPVKNMNGPESEVRLRIMVVDDHPVMLFALQRMLCTELPQATVFSSNSLSATLSQLRVAPFDLVLLDLFLDSDPLTHQMAGLKALQQEFPNLPVAVMTGNDSPDLEQMVKNSGARAFLSKRSSGPQICQQLTALLPQFEQSSKTLLSRKFAALKGRRLEVLNLIAEGKSNKEISSLLNISLHTVKSHVSMTLSLLEVGSRAKAVALIQQLDVDSPGWRDANS